jgi:hypothetical protein
LGNCFELGGAQELSIGKIHLLSKQTLPTKKLSGMYPSNSPAYHSCSLHFYIPHYLLEVDDQYLQNLQPHMSHGIEEKIKLMND